MRGVKLVVAAMVLAAVGSACSTKAESATTSKNVSIVSQDGKASVLEMVDLGKTGFGPGDQLIEHAPVTDKSGIALGQSVTAVSIVAGKSMEEATGLVTCTIQLAGGDLLFVGAVEMKELAEGADLPVVGGTGDYAGASGTVKMQSPDMEHTNLDFVLRLPEPEDG
jgi:hypothetical protein